MNARERDMIADRQLRDAALALVKADIENVKEDVSAKSIKDRVTSRLTDGALELFDEANAMADNKLGVLATLLAAVGIWFARNPIIAALGLEEDELDPETADEIANDAEPRLPLETDA